MGFLVRDRKDSWHKKYQRKPEERRQWNQKSVFFRGKEKREEFIQSHEAWVKRCEAARRAEEAAPEARHIFKISVEMFLAAKEVEQGRSNDVADKVWQASQSNHKKRENMEADLNKMLLAMKKCGWAKAKEDTARLWAEK